jgi:hypothetical protein
MHDQTPLHFISATAEAPHSDLFSWAGVPAQETPAPRRHLLEEYLQRIIDRAKNRVAVDIGVATARQNSHVYRIEPNTQARFHFEEARIIRFVPRSHSAFLGKRLTSLFGHRRALHNVALRLAKDDIVFVGDLARLDQHIVLVCLRRNRTLMSEITKALEDIGVPFGAAFPWWKRPDRY